MSATGSADIALYLAAGAALGAVHFLLLFHAVQMHASKAAASWIIPLHSVRLAAAVSAFWLIAQQGALPLLLALVGFVVVRIVAQRLARPA